MSPPRTMTSLVIDEPTSGPHDGRETSMNAVRLLHGFHAVALSFEPMHFEGRPHIFAVAIDDSGERHVLARCAGRPGIAVTTALCAELAGRGLYLEATALIEVPGCPVAAQRVRAWLLAGPPRRTVLTQVRPGRGETDDADGHIV